VPRKRLVPKFPQFVRLFVVRQFKRFFGDGIRREGMQPRGEAQGRVWYRPFDTSRLGLGENTSTDRYKGHEPTHESTQDVHWDITVMGTGGKMDNSDDRSFTPNR